MVTNPEQLKPPKSADKQGPTTRMKRKALLDVDPTVQTEALALLAKGKDIPAQAWYVLEGRSRPDVYIETADAIIVIEGKRTEPTATTKTNWLRGRDQMLRHIDCAFEVRGTRRVYGFLIVEGKDDGRVPKKWREVCADTVSTKTLDTSLPHRSPDERRAIADAFLGATTWHQVCDTLGLAGIL